MCELCVNSTRAFVFCLCNQKTITFYWLQLDTVTALTL